MRRDSLRHYSIFALIGICLVALSLPRFGFLWHIHTGGETTHTHDVYTLAHEAQAPHTRPAAPHEHVHSHPHDQSHDHGSPHDPAENVKVRLVDATSHGLHGHYFDDSLPTGYCLPLLLTLVVLTIMLRCFRRQAQPLRHLSPPTARAPPVIA
jgi:hypothetical protein